MAMLITFILSSYAYVFKVYSMVILTTNDAFVDPAFRNLFNSTYIDHTSTEDGATYWLHGTNWYILVVFACSVRVPLCLPEQHHEPHSAARGVGLHVLAPS